MAKLSSYYTLCPLIDQQNLLGVERDSDAGCAIVTLGRNIVIRYKLQDLKQLSSWTSKERLTTQVIYDKHMNRYAAVFNAKKIRVWSDEESDLNNVKGYKFQYPFYTILTSQELPSVLVQQNGATASLDWALKNRKSWASKGILKSKEKILDCHLIHLNGKTSLCYLTKVEQTYNCIMTKLEPETYLEETNHLRRIELKRKSEELVGHVVMQNKNNAYLLALWSHGRLYSHPLIDTSTESESHSLISVLTEINTNYPVVMTSLSETTIAIYGADVSEEGAVLIIYNVQFKLVQAVQKLKLYTKDAKLWRIEDKLLLAANRHLAIAPFHLAPQKIAALLGSSTCKKDSNKESNEDDVVIIQESMIAQWDECQSVEKRLTPNKIPASITKQISSYINEGLSDAAIQTTLIPQLIESCDISAIIWCLDVFKDLPERLLTDLLVFTLRSPEDVFVPFQNGMESDTMLTVDSLHRRNFFLDKILSLSYSDICLVSYLKHSISFDEILRLLNYLIQRLRDHGNTYDNIEQPSEKQLFEWSCLLLDSHYQQYILSRDTEVLILLNELNVILEDHLQLLKDMENLRPILIRTINGKPLKLASNSYNKFYNIEEISLY